MIIRAEGKGFRVAIDKAAWDSYTVSGHRCLLAFSAVGTGTEVRAVRAALGVNHKVDFAYSRHESGGMVSLRADPEGYKTWARPLGLRQYHLLAMSSREGFLPNGDEESVWEYLSRTTTTPMDRRWMPEIISGLRARNRFQEVLFDGNINPTMLTGVDDAVMDEVVVELVRGQHVRIEA